MFTHNVKSAGMPLRKLARVGAQQAAAPHSSQRTGPWLQPERLQQKRWAHSPSESLQSTSHTLPCLFISATFLGNEKLTHYYQRKLEILLSIMQTSRSKNQIQLAL